MELNNVASVREMFECMSTETLKEILNNELRKELVDDNAIRMITSILRERNKGKPVEITQSIQNAWEKYQKDSEKIWRESKRARKIRNWMIKAGVAVAVFILLLIPIVPKYAGAESIWQKIASWTSDFFGFSTSIVSETTSGEPEFQTEINGLQQVYEAVTDIGITTSVVPTWLPDNPELVECNTISSPAKDTVKAVFANENGELMLYYSVYRTNADYVYYKDNTEVKLYEVDGISHNIMRNNDRFVAVWVIDNIECAITIDCQEDILFKILESIYEMEAN